MKTKKLKTKTKTKQTNHLGSDSILSLPCHQTWPKKKPKQCLKKQIVPSFFWDGSMHAKESKPIIQHFYFLFLYIICTFVMIYWNDKNKRDMVNLD